MGLSLITAPAREPISLQEAKDHLRVTATDEDALIESLITAARQTIEGRFGVIQRALITQTWDWTLDGFPSDSTVALQVPFPPLQSVTSITYLDGDGASQTWSAAKYTVDAKSLIGRIIPAWDEDYPETRSVINAVTVRFAAGFGGAQQDVPMPIRQAMLLLIGHMYENRETHIMGVAVAELPTVDRLLAPYRIASF